MKTLFKLALAGALAVVFVKLARQWSREANRNDVSDWQPDAGSPLRGENLQVEPTVTH